MSAITYEKEARIKELEESLAAAKSRMLAARAALFSGEKKDCIAAMEKGIDDIDDFFARCK